MENVNLSNLLGRIFGTQTSATTGTTAKTSTTKSTMSYSDEYKTSLADLETLRESGAITWTEYVQLKKELEADKNVKQNVFDSNQDGLITGYENDLYEEFVSAKENTQDINLNQKYQQDCQEIYQMASQGVISWSEYSQFKNEARQEYYANRQKDTDGDGVLSAEEQNISSFKEKVALYKKMDKDSDGEFNENEQAALDAYNEAIANPDETFQTIAISDLVSQCNTVADKLAMYKEMNQFDLDGDGKLNYAEYQSMQAYNNPPEKTGAGEDETETTTLTEEDLIAKFDLDGDGVLNETEQAALDAYKASLGIGNTEEDAELIAKFDLDGDGVLNEAEQAALDAYKEKKEEAELIAKFDVNGDGVLDTAEQAALEAYKEQKENEELMQKFDIDGNGVLDAAEQAALAAYKEQKENEELMQKFDLDGNGVLDMAEQAAMNAYKSARGNIKYPQEIQPLTYSVTQATPVEDTVIPVEDTTVAEDTSEQQSLLDSMKEELAALMAKLKNIATATLVSDANETEEEEETSSSSRSSGSGSSKKVEEKEETPSLFDRMLEYRISQEMHEMIDTDVIELDEEMVAEEAKEGLDVVEEKFDIDGNGALDETEQVQHNTYIRRKAQQRVDEKFDINGDGTLDEDETAIRDDYVERVAEKHAAEENPTEGEIAQAGDTAEASDTIEAGDTAEKADTSADSTETADTSGETTKAENTVGDTSSSSAETATSSDSSAETKKPIEE